MYSDYYDSIAQVAGADPEVAAAMNQELQRQRDNIELIASENLVSPAVMAAMGSVLTNKYAEGLPGKRYYGGCQYVDVVEKIAIERACKLFGAKYANVQPHSGAQANTAVYFALLKPGDTVMGMALDNGGHLTHGSPVNISGKYFNFVPYGVNDEGFIDYAAFAKQVNKVKPKLIVAGASAYPREIDFQTMADIAHANGAMFMVDMAHIAGLVAAEVIPSPIPYADFVSSSTTKTFCGARSGMVFCKAEHAKMLDKGTFPGCLGSIHLATMAAKAWSFKYAATDEFKAIMKQVLINGKTLADELNKHGFRVVSGTTDNHLVMVDLRPKGLTGKQFQIALDKVGITVNKNQIPFDTASPFVTSGVRIGVTSITQRGLKEAEVKEIVEIMDQVAAAPEDEANLADCKAKAEALIARFPLYPAGSFEE